MMYTCYKYVCVHMCDYAYLCGVEWGGGSFGRIKDW